MKRFIASITLLITLACAIPQSGHAAVHHSTIHHTKKHRITHVAKLKRSSLRKSRGTSMSMAQTTFYDLPPTGEDCDNQCMLSSADSGYTSTTMAVIASQQLPPGITQTPGTYEAPLEATAPGVFAERMTPSPDTAVNNYYETYQTPAMVTINGISVPVTGSPYYYSIIKDRHGEPMPLHNRKGTETADNGVSLRSTDIPESIGAPAYSGTAYSSTPNGR